MRLIYLDCSSGAAGDMLLGALIDAGSERDFVLAQLGRLDIDGWDIEFAETARGGLRSLAARVSVAEETGRTYARVKEIVAGAGLDEAVAATALQAFSRLAEAESRVHGTEKEDIHFHEVGTTDAIVDVVGAVAALTTLRPDRVVASPVAVGSGRARTAHGSLPIPAPATIEILAAVDAPVFAGGEGELTTPTGAALLATVVDEFGELPPMRPSTVGYGAGSQEREVPNVLRVIIGTADDADEEARLVLEANIDDMAPELFPHVIERLLEAGADDAWVTPIVMKKGRPALTLTALAPRSREGALAGVFFTETTTLGLRTAPVGKRYLERDWVLVDVAGSPVQVKVARFEGRVTNMAPEYDDAVAAARGTGLPLKEVYRLATESAREQLGVTPL